MYTENEIHLIMGWAPGHNLGADRLIKKCAKAGLIIELAQERTGGGKAYKYNIIQDNRSTQAQWIPDALNRNYEVNANGEIRNKHGALVGSQDGKGYLKASNNDGKLVGVHRHIYFSFHPEDLINYDELTIDHIDGRRTNNSLDNLRPLSKTMNSIEMNNNQSELQSIMFQLIQKYGYETLKNKLIDLL